MKKFRIRVPATTANLGPGFDAFGCALARYNCFTFTQEAAIDDFSFENVLPAFANRENLAVQAYLHATEQLGVPPTPFRLRIDADIPVSSGMGSSATLIVAGVMAAFLLHDLPQDLPRALTLATQIEGHPDNVAPAIFGGLTVCVTENGTPTAVSFPIHPSVHLIALLPDYPLSTALSRSVLPASVSYADAVFNLSHAVLLTRALATGDAALISHALQDRLHQPYRAPLIHDYDAVRDAAMSAGCCGFCLSGAGPTCLAITTDPTSAKRLSDALPAVSSHYTPCPLVVDTAGVQIEIL